MLELKDAKEYALTVFKICKEVVSVNLTWRELDKLPYCSGYAIEATFVDGSVGRLSKIRGLFPLPLLVQYNPGDFIDENCLWMHVVEDYLGREDSKGSFSLGEIGFLRLLSDTFEFISIPSNLTSRDLDTLRVELDLMGVEA